METVVFISTMSTITLVIILLMSIMLDSMDIFGFWFETIVKISMVLFISSAGITIILSIIWLCLSIS